MGIKIGKLSYSKEAILPSGFRETLGNTRRCNLLIDSCTIQYSDDFRTACFQLLDGGLLCVLASQLEEFFEGLFWHVIRYQPSPCSSDQINLTPWFLIESPRLISPKWANPPRTATNGWTRLFFDYDVELPMTDENGLTMDTFDRQQFDAAVDSIARSLSRCVLNFFRVDALTDAETSLVIIRDSTVIQRKQIDDTPHIKVGVHFVFPNLVFQVGSAEIWTAYVLLFEHGILKSFGHSGPQYMNLSGKCPIFAHSIHFDTAVITKTDAKLRGTGMYKCETCPGDGGGDKHSPRCICSGSRRVLAKGKGWYRPTRKLYIDGGAAHIEKMRMADQALEACSLDDLRRIYTEEYRASCITPKYHPVGDGDDASWAPAHTAVLKPNVALLAFPSRKKNLFEHNKDQENLGGARKRKPLRSNQVFSKRQSKTFTALQETRGSVRALEDAAADFEISLKSYLMDDPGAVPAGAPARFVNIRVRPFALIAGGEKRITLVSPSFHFKDAQTLSLHVAYGLIKDRTLRGIRISEGNDQPMLPQVAARVNALIASFFDKYCVDPVNLSFRTYCRVCPQKVLNALSASSAPAALSAPSASETSPASPSPEALSVRHKFLRLYTAAQRTAYKQMTVSEPDYEGAPPLHDYLTKTHEILGGLLSKETTQTYLGRHEAIIRKMASDALRLESFQHGSNTVRVKVVPITRRRTPDLSEWVAGPSQPSAAGSADDLPLVEMEGVDLVFECWSEKCKSCWARRASQSLFRVPIADEKMAKDLFFCNSVSGSKPAGGARLEALDPSTVLKIGPRELWRLVKQDLVEISKKK